MGNNAQARKRVPIIYSTGLDLKEIKQATAADVAFLTGQELNATEMSDLKESISSDLKVGMKYSHFGLLFMNVWTWDGEIVLFEGDTYYDIDVTQAVAIGKYGKPFLYSFPLLFLIIVVGGGFYLLTMILSMRNTETAPVGNRAKHMGAAPDSQVNSEEVRPSQAVPVEPKKALSYKTDFTMDEVQAMYEQAHYQQALALYNQSQNLMDGIDYLAETGMSRTEARYSLQALVKP